jgi:hypothetical protein
MKHDPTTKAVVLAHRSALEPNKMVSCGTGRGKTCHDDVTAVRGVVVTQCDLKMTDRVAYNSIGIWLKEILTTCLVYWYVVDCS